MSKDNKEETLCLQENKNQNKGGIICQNINWIVCDDRSAPTVETPHSGDLKIRGGTLAQEMGLGKRQIPEGIIYLFYVF